MVWITVAFLLGGLMASLLAKPKLVLDQFRLFCLLWLVVFVLGRINLFDMYTVSNEFYNILSIGIICWILGYAFARFFNVHFTFRELHFMEPYGINRSVLIAYILIMIVFIMLIGIKILGYLRSGFSYSRLHKYVSGLEEEQVFRSAIVNKIHELILYPVLLASIPAATIVVLRERKKLIGFVALALVVAYSLVSGRRLLLVYIVLDFVISMGFFGIRIPRKIQKKLFRYGLIAVALILLMTALRRNVFETRRWNEIYRQMYLYATLCLQVGDHWLGVVRAEGLHTYGYSFLRGIVTLVHLPLSPLGVRIYSQEIAQIYNLTQSVRISIGHTQTANAFSTWVYYFYLDFRMVGVVLGSLFFGSLIGFGENTLRWRPNNLNFAYYLLLSQAVIKSIVRWEFAVPEYILAFVFLKLLVRRFNVNSFSVELRRNE